MAWLDGHHQQDFPHLWCAAFPGSQEELVELEPDILFRPPYVGHRGWLGIRMDRDYPWDEIARHCREAYVVIAPKRLAALVDLDTDA